MALLLVVAMHVITSNKKLLGARTLLGAPAIATRSILTTSNNKLLVIQDMWRLPPGSWNSSKPTLRHALPWPVVVVLRRSSKQVVDAEHEIYVYEHYRVLMLMLCMKLPLLIG